LKVLYSASRMVFNEEQVKKIKSLANTEFLVHIDEGKAPGFPVDDIDYLINSSIFKHIEIDEFKSLKQIQLLSAGLNKTPVERANELNIEIKRAADVYSIPIAEFVIMRTLQIYKDARYFERIQKEKTWEKKRSLIELCGKTVGIVGFGSIGKETAKRFSAFDTTIIGFGRSEKKSVYLDKFYNIKEIKEKIGECDIVVASLPHTDETHKMFNKDVFGAMKDDSIFINVARGKLVDEEELIRQIEKNKFLGVALDVTYNEPLTRRSELWSLKNVYLSPHNSFTSSRIYTRLFECVYKNLTEFSEKNSKQ